MKIKVELSENSVIINISNKQSEFTNRYKLVIGRGETTRLTSRIETKEEVNASSTVYERGVGATILELGAT